MNKPNLYFLIGLPASGKSTYAEKKLNNTNIHSSDKIREELFGDVGNQENNGLVFQTLEKRVINDIKNGNDVTYDATGISSKKRKVFLEKIRRLNSNKIAVLFATPYEKCLEQNSKRDRVVPENVIKRMYLNFDMPFSWEGWDEIRIVWNYDEDNYDTSDLSKTIYNFNQHSTYHKYSLGEHCEKTAENIQKMGGGYSPKEIQLCYAAIYHDIGKIFTQEFKDRDGNLSDKARYLQHHHISAYESMFYLNKNGLYESIILEICQLIRWHMYPYNIKLDKTRDKFIRMVGQDFYDTLMILHEADKLAH